MTTVIVHVGYALMLGALVVRDMLWLRARDPILWTRSQSVVGHDLVEKLRRPVREDAER